MVKYPNKLGSKAESDYLNKLSEKIHKQNVEAGWWSDPDTCLVTKVQLIITEISEATEGVRKNLMDDHLPHRKMEEVELADALIRTLDLGGRLGLKFENHQLDEQYFSMLKENSENPAKLHFHLTLTAAAFGSAIDDVYDTTFYYCVLVQIICVVAAIRGLDLFGALNEKIKYNENRSDHKPENRQKENGKKF